MQLHRTDVLNGAMALLDAEGLDGLTMRKLASQLGVQAGGLYWHFKNKQALLEAMADRLVEGVGAPLPPGPWDEQLAALAHRARQALLSHRDGARVVAGTYVTEPNTILAGTAAIAALRGTGIPATQAAWVSYTLFNYVLGHTIEEQAQGELADDEWEAKLSAFKDSQDPDLAQAVLSTFDADPAERFAYSIELILDGIRHRISTPHD